jgi:hypothetical protein
MPGVSQYFNSNGFVNAELCSKFGKSLHMKSILTLSASLTIFSTAFYQTALSQVETVQMGANFSDISKFSSHGTGYEGFQTYSPKDVDGSPYFNANWSTGSVTTTSKETFAGNLVFLYDKLKQQLYIKTKDSATVIQADKAQISSFSLITGGGTHTFVPAWSYTPANNADFFEILVKDDKGYTLLKQNKSKYVKADPRDMEKQRLGEVYDAYQDQNTYFIHGADGSLVPVELKERSLEKALAPIKNKVSSYYEQHRDSELNENYLIGLVQSLNGQ